MPTFIRSLLAAGMIAAGVALGLAGCGPQPTYQVVQTPAARVGTVESVREIVEQAQPGGAGLVLGALAGGGLGSLVGSGTGRTVVARLFVSVTDDPEPVRASARRRQ